MMTDKRPLASVGEDAGSAAPDQASKKPRIADGTSVPAPAPARPGLSLEALQKAKKALELQKQLKEKLKSLPQLHRPAAPAPAAHGHETSGLMAAAAVKAAQIAARFHVEPAPSLGVVPVSTPASSMLLPPPPPLHTAAPAPVSIGSAKAAPLRLDLLGRAVDEFGNVLGRSVVPVPTLKVNQLVPGKPTLGTASVLPPPPPQQGVTPSENLYFDERMETRGPKPRRPRATFDFVQPGELQRDADAFRFHSRLARRPLLPQGPIGPVSVPVVPLADENQEGLAGGQDSEGEAELPVVEWWDKNLLQHASYEEDVPADPSQPIPIKENKITHYVEHPVPIQPPAEAAQPPPQPLKLTTREMKKLRTQRRQAREKEKQDLIRQGLLEPAKPKVKLSNLYRVLGEQAVADPTMLEMETRKQMAERQAAHDDRNMSRALTPAERSDKKLRRLFDDTGTEVITSVYKVHRLDTRLNRYKVDVNARENHMTGVVLVTPEFCLVVVEGCNKAIKRYAKLMLRRIDWDLPPTAKEAHAHMDVDEEEEEERPPNPCFLVWQGLVKSSAFTDLKVEECRTVEHAQQILAQRGVGHYWDAARNFVPGEAPIAELI